MGNSNAVIHRLPAGARELFFHLFRVAPLPHATSSLSACLGAGLADLSLQCLAEGAVLAGLCAALPASGWFALALLCLADGYCRRREYLRLKAMLGRWGFRPRMFASVAGSRCQRDAALAAARDTGHLARTREHFRALGYSWYDLLPDRCVDDPLRFFSREFLRATFRPCKRPARQTPA